MKNLLVYINPNNKFDEESETLVKVQIDNSLELEWDVKDIMLVTNFDYEYMGVKSLVVDAKFYPDSPVSSKFTAIQKLFEGDFIGDDLYWFHDLDAFQLEKISELDIDLGSADMSAIVYCLHKRWNLGSFFFRLTSKDIFDEMVSKMDELGVGDEKSLAILTNEDEKLKERIKPMNFTYNFVPFNTSAHWRNSILPLRVAHFHPLNPQRQIRVEKPLDLYKARGWLNSRIVNIFDGYGIK